MAGPWEKYQTQAPAPSAPAAAPGPWEKYQQSTEPVVRGVQETQQPDITFKERFIAKNFANSPETQIKYLQQQHPELEIRVMNGRVVARRQEDQHFQVLDPNNLDLQDISDVAYDVPAGALAGAASALGGVGGALTPVPGGALAGAALAGGGTSAGLEALRQKIGQYMGIPQEMDTGQVLTSAAVGAAAPVLLGTGASSGLSSKLAQYLGQNVAPEAIAEAQKGLISRGASKAGPGLAQMFSGVPKEATKTYMKNPEAVDALIKQGDSGATALAETAYEKLKSGLAEKKSEIGQKLSSAIKDTVPDIDITPVKAAIDSHIATLEAKGLSNQASQQELKDLKAARDFIFKKETQAVDEAGNVVSKLEEIPDRISPEAAFDLQKNLSEYGDLSSIKPGLVSRHGKATPSEKQWANANMDAYNKMNEGLSDATGGVSSQLKSEYKNYLDLQKNLNKHFSSPEKTFSTLSSLEGNNKTVLRDTLDQVKRASSGDIDLKQEADLLQAYKHFANPSLTPISSGGTVSTGRMGLGGAVGYALGKKTGIPGADVVLGGIGTTAFSPWALKNVGIPLARGTQAVGGAVANPTTANILANILRRQEE